jgi:hypothetical protein
VPREGTLRREVDAYAALIEKLAGAMAKVIAAFEESVLTRSVSGTPALIPTEVCCANVLDAAVSRRQATAVPPQKDESHSPRNWQVYGFILFSPKTCRDA